MNARLVDIVQCYWSLSERILVTIDSEYLHNMLTGHSHPSYVSVYNDTVFGVSPSSKEVNNDPLLTRTDYPIGCIISYPTRMFMWNQDGNSVETPAYMWDFLCVHRDYRDKNLDRLIIFFICKQEIVFFFTDNLLNFD